MKNADKRGSRRFPVSVKVSFFDGKEWITGFTTDLSRTGFFLHTERSALKPGSVHVFSFPVLEIPKFRLSILGRVARRTSRSDGARFTGLGVEFVEVASTVGFSHLYRFLTGLCRIDVKLTEELLQVKEHAVFLYNFRERDFTIMRDEMLADRRRRGRVPYTNAITYQVGGKSQIGTICNISPEGVFVETMDRLPEPGEKVFIELPVKVDGSKTLFKLIGHLRWNRMAIPPLSLKSGFGLEFTTVQGTSEEFPSFKHFIRHLIKSRK